MTKVISFFLLVLLPLTAMSASTQCLSGTAGNDHLIQQLASAKKSSPISTQLTEKYNLENKPAESTSSGCPNCQQGPGFGPLNFGNHSTAQFMRQIAPDTKLLLRTDCLSASGKTDTSTTELKCPEGQLSSKYNFCFDSNLMRYQNAAITDFYKCVKKITNFPITPAGLFEMYSLESGFKPHYAYSGGVGMGQLTGIFVDDINQKHRGFKILKKVADTSDKDCEIAKTIAAKDIQKPIRLKNNRCNFVEYGEGMERNVLYTLIGLANSWNKDIEPVMEKYIAKNKGHASLARAKELALLNSYGPGGRAAARAAVRRLTKLSPTQFVDQIQKPMSGTKTTNLTSYIGKIQKRQKQLLSDMPKAQRTAYNKEGARACVNK